MFLATAAYSYLAAYNEARAKNTIGTLMLVTGLAGSLSLPVSAWLETFVTWRGVAFAYAGVMLVFVFPALHFLLQNVSLAQETGTKANSEKRNFSVLLLIAAAISLNSFVALGIEYIGIELFRAMGAEFASAVAIASALGFFKVGGRVIDLLGGQKWDGLSTALISGAMMISGLVIVSVFGFGVWQTAAYLCLFGIGSGAAAVARQTMPLVFYKKADYTAAISTIALPMNLINALAPFAIAALLVRTGPVTVLYALAVVSTIAFVMLLVLGRMKHANMIAKAVMFAEISKLCVPIMQPIAARRAIIFDANKHSTDSQLNCKSPMQQKVPDPPSILDCRHTNKLNGILEKWH